MQLQPSTLCLIALLSLAAPAMAAADLPPPENSQRPLDPKAGTYDLKEMVTAANSALGDASEAVAKIVEKIFSDLGQPNAYIVGREGSGAFIVGLRYGAGTLYSKVEGERKVHWTGPSLGPDFGGDASRTFTLVYHLDDTEELFHRYPAVEGRAYLIGGVSANYHQRGNVVLVPIRLGAGLRLGANLGYVRYSKEGRVLPF